MEQCCNFQQHKVHMKSNLFGKIALPFTILKNFWNIQHAVLNKKSEVAIYINEQS